MGEISKQSNHFYDFMIYCNDGRCWSVCIATLVHLIDNNRLNYKEYSEMIYALQTFDKWIGTDKGTFHERIPSIEKKHLPYLFLVIPRFVCIYYYNELLSGMNDTTDFRMVGMPLIIKDAANHGNWFLAGMEIFYKHCSIPSDCEIMLRLLGCIPVTCPVFAQATKEDVIPFVRMTRDKPFQKQQVFQLFQQLDAYSLLVPYCVFDKTTLPYDLELVVKQSRVFLAC